MRRPAGSALVVTNHALLAIDALHGGTALPEYDALVIDEAHELISRVTGAASVELSPSAVERVAKRCLAWLSDDTGLDFLDAADVLQAGLDAAEVGRITDPSDPLKDAFAAVRVAARAAVSGLTSGDDDDVERRQAQGAAQEVFDIAERLAKLDERDVIWVSESERFGRQAVCAPLSVAGLLRTEIFDLHPSVLTSATLKVGGEFGSVGVALGLGAPQRAAIAPLMWARHSTIAVKESCTLHATCRRPVAMASAPRCWLRSPSCCGRPTATRWACSPRSVPLRPPRAIAVSRCPTVGCCAKETPIWRA